MIGRKVRLREKRVSDAANDYAWRRDPDLCRLDAVTPIRSNFSEFLLAYEQDLWRSGNRRQRFAIETLDSRHIGNCTYHNLDEQRGEVEVGIMIGDRAYWDRGYGSDALSMLVDYLFSTTKLRRVYLHTLDWNKRAQRAFEKCGFVAFARVRRQGLDFVVMELRREWWRHPQKQTAKDASLGGDHSSRPG